MTPLGTPTLSSSTRNLPCSSRTRSIPETCTRTPFGGPDALRDAREDQVPLGTVEHAGHDVDGERALLLREVEGDPPVDVRPREPLGSRTELTRRHLGECLVHLAVRRANLTGPVEHRIPRRARGVAIKKVRHGATRIPACSRERRGVSDVSRTRRGTAGDLRSRQLSTP